MPHTFLRSPITHHRIHIGLLESMAHVQAAGDVRRWNNDTEAILAGIAMWFEITAVFPVAV